MPAGSISFLWGCAAAICSKQIGPSVPIILYSLKPYTLRYLVDIFGITNNTPIRIQPNSTETVDIEIRLGPDWIKKLPPEN